ncbi:MAG: response regulator [Desulfobacterales bacterium]|jgi:CheY-like chemotaxis protein
MANRKILVVDDERDMRIFVSTVVATSGFEAAAANNGTEALQKAVANPPALVILDVMMPQIVDGIETYRQFRTHPDLDRIPIVILSAIARKTFLHSIRVLSPRLDIELPAPDAYMEKPPDAGELSRLINTFLKHET